LAGLTGAFGRDAGNRKFTEVFDICSIDGSLSYDAVSVGHFNDSSFCDLEALTTG
jgi:hypothetical protein